MNQWLLNKLSGIIYVFNKRILFEGINELKLINNQWMNERSDHSSDSKAMVVSLLHTTYAHVVNSTGPLRSYKGWDKRMVVHCKIFCIFFSFLTLHCDMTDPPIISGTYLSSLCIWVSHVTWFAQWVIGKYYASRGAVPPLLLWKTLRPPCEKAELLLLDDEKHPVQSSLLSQVTGYQLPRV